MKYMNERKRIPTLQEYMADFKPPNFFDDERTPEEVKEAWRNEYLEKYYKLYGEEKIESTRIKKEGE